MNPKIEKEIKKAVDNRIISWAFIEYLKHCEREIRAKIIEKIVMYTLGSFFTFNILNFIFRKEIAEMIDDVQNLTKDKLTAFIDKLKKFRAKKHSK